MAASYLAYGKVLNRQLKFGSGAKSAEKLATQMQERGWNESSLINTARDPCTIRYNINRVTGNPSMAYYTKGGGCVVVDNFTDEIVQINDPNWIPDSDIINPYLP